MSSSNIPTGFGNGKEKDWKISNRANVPEIMPEELNLVNEFIDNVSENPDFSQSIYKKLHTNMPFKISRAMLNNYIKERKPGDTTDVPHSFLVLPNETGEGFTIAAKMRGTIEEEGIIGHGMFGKFLETSLVIDGDQYGIKVLPNTPEARREFSIMQKIQEAGAHRKQWFFTRNEAERSEDHAGKLNINWIYDTVINDKAYIVQRLIPGKDLLKYFQDPKKETILYNNFFALQIALAAALALKAVHDAGVVHKDLHKGNLILDYDHKLQKFVIEITDYGTAAYYPNKENFDKASREDIEDLSDIFNTLGIPDDLFTGDQLSGPMDANDIIAKLDVNDIIAKLQELLPEDLDLLTYLEIAKAEWEWSAEVSDKIKDVIQHFYEDFSDLANEDVHAIAVEILQLLKENITTGSNNVEDVDLFNMEVLTRLPPMLYLECYSILSELTANWDNKLERIIRDGTSNESEQQINTAAEDLRGIIQGYTPSSKLDDA